MIDTYFGIALIFLAVLLSIYKPMMGLAVAAQGYVLRGALAPTALGAGSAQNDVVMGVLLPVVVFILAASYVYRHRRALHYRFFWADAGLLLMAGVLLLGAFYAPEPANSLNITVRYVALGISYYFVARFLVACSNFQAINGYLFATWCIGVATALMAVLDPVYTTRGRLALGASQPIPFSLLLGMAVLINVYWATAPRDRRPVPTWLCVPALLFVTYVFLLTDTRGTTLALAISLTAFFLMIAATSKKRSLYIRVAALALGGAVGLSLYVHEMPDKFQVLARSFGRLASNSIGESAADRVSAYQVAEKLFFSNPIFGAGTGSFSHYGAISYVHNFFLEILSENGMLGLFAIWFFLFGVVRCGWIGLFKNREPLQPLLLALFCYTFVEAQVSFTLWMQKNLFIHAALIVAAFSLARQGARAQESQDVSSLTAWRAANNG